MCDLILLVNNSNSGYIILSHRSQDIMEYCSNFLPSTEAWCEIWSYLVWSSFCPEHFRRVRDKWTDRHYMLRFTALHGQTGNIEDLSKNGHYAFQGHSRSLILLPMQKPVCNFMCVNNSNLRHILNRFRDTADYWSNFCPQQGVPLCLTHLSG